MAKSINSSNKNEDEEIKSAELTAAAEEEAGVEFDSLVAVSRDQENQDVKAKKRGSERGKSMPLLKRLRDPNKDKQPLAPEQMGLAEDDSFLTTRELRPIDLRRHQDVHQKDFLGTNFRKPRDFMRMFEKGKSSKQQPKLDLSENIEANPILKKELIAEQVLRNLHSRNRPEVKLMSKLLKDIDVTQDEIQEYKDDRKAHRNKEFIQQLQDKIPSDAI
jgi:hypothetical protein